jgi:hypothetical protein
MLTTEGHTCVPKANTRGRCRLRRTRTRTDPHRHTLKRTNRRKQAHTTTNNRTQPHTSAYSHMQAHTGTHTQCSAPLSRRRGGREGARGGHRSASTTSTPQHRRTRAMASCASKSPGSSTDRKKNLRHASNALSDHTSEMGFEPCARREVRTKGGQGALESAAGGEKPRVRASARGSATRAVQCGMRACKVRVSGVRGACRVEAARCG